MPAITVETCPEHPYVLRQRDGAGNWECSACRAPLELTAIEPHGRYLARLPDPAPDDPDADPWAAEIEGHGEGPEDGSLALALGGTEPAPGDGLPGEDETVVIP